MGLHSSDSGYSRYVSDWEPAREYLPFQPSPFRVMALGHRDIEDTISALILHGAAVRNPDLKFAVVENGSHWVPPLADGLERCIDRCRRSSPNIPSIRCAATSTSIRSGRTPWRSCSKSSTTSTCSSDRITRTLRDLADPLSFADHLGGLPEASVRKIMGVNLAGLLKLRLPEWVG